MSGIFAAAVGGWIAGTFTPTEDVRMKAVSGITAWAIATLIVVGVSGVAATASATAAGAPGGPVMTASRTYQMASQGNSGARRETIGARIDPQTTLDDARSSSPCLCCSAQPRWC
jgi:hypothetical protein